MAMQMTQGAFQRLEQRQLLTPRMIQSMEILQMPLAALEERIEQELQSNPALEVKEGRGDGPDVEGEATYDDNKELSVDKDVAEDFERLAKIADYLENEEYGGGGLNGQGLDHGPRVSSYSGERDAKMDAMANTACRAGTIGEHLTEQWRLVEAEEPVKLAGRILIGSIDADGYLRTPLEALRKEAEDRGRGEVPPIETFEAALGLVQRMLEPPGVGARDLQECLLIQLDHIAHDSELAEGHDLPLERKLVREHLKDLEMNRYPQIAKKTGKDIETLKRAVGRLGRLHPHPGKQVGPDDAHAITPDAFITYNERDDAYDVEMTHDPAPSLYIRGMYRKMLKDRNVEKNTREFLSGNIRNARWLIESIKQRRGTIERVIRKVVEHQRDFFDKGPEHLRPLPMIQVADELGIHVATVSRAVAEKYIQTPRGIFPLRRFFSGGTTTDDGQDMSWDAVKEKLKTIVANEDKTDPLNDDQIADALKEQGIELARRTVAKYRKILHIPTTRQRREY